ncbi:hypothetical protein HALLA_09695 [Halostagnicola larsenii XH-48]|uniref:Uncharacterized protein n=1 Tax=Halostagnicola larsenii XH-48 TaxID=797299 RepID=W0JV00_9EURY|nr:hypothetical protein HALLA_09530 [Halostagnicola larsenii XH-48]AHG00858.1 hypothetical protein HALLA_09695 [Halostagnicola larsenii XH-48]
MQINGRQGFMEMMGRLRKELYLGKTFLKMVILAMF